MNKNMKRMTLLVLFGIIFCVGHAAMAMEKDFDAKNLMFVQNPFFYVNNNNGSDTSYVHGGAECHKPEDQTNYTFQAVRQCCHETTTPDGKLVCDAYQDCKQGTAECRDSQNGSLYKVNGFPYECTECPIKDEMQFQTK